MFAALKAPASSYQLLAEYFQSKCHLPGASGKVTERLLEFLNTNELKLREAQRLPMSTRILESCFGLYKQLKRKHGKGGFTCLLASFGALQQSATL